MLAWLLALFSGLSAASTRGISSFTKEIPALLLAGAGFLATTPFYLAWLGWMVWNGEPVVVETAFWLVLAIHVPIFAVTQVITVLAHRATSATLTAPYLALTPAYLLLTSPLLGTGSMTLAGAFGILLLTLGVYILNTGTGRKNPRDVARAIVREKGSRYMFLAGLLFAITAPLDLLAIRHASIPLYLLLDHGLVGVICIGFYLRDRRKNPNAESGRTTRGVLFAAFLFGLTMALSVIPFMIAISWMEHVPYAIATKRTGEVLFTIFLSLIVVTLPRFSYRREEELENLGFRLPGVAVMMVAMILILVFGQA